MKNKLTDLNDHLFTQLERLNDENLDADGVVREIGRANAVAKVAGAVIDNANLALRAQIALGERQITVLPKLLAQDPE